MRGKVSVELRGIMEKFNRLAFETKKLLDMSHGLAAAGGPFTMFSIKEQGDKIEKMKRELEQTCYRLMEQQPFTVDMGRIGFVLKSLPDVERIGDYAFHLGRMRDELGVAGYKDKGIPLEEMYAITRQMLEGVMAVLAGMDEELAGQIMEQDLLLGKINREVHGELNFHIETTPEDLLLEVAMTKAARFYERIGDHIVNVCERLTQSYPLGA
ncbi:phosphate signaling complex PhoU family protein [Anaerotalea alkaliphila]|uniref:PhoU domain-containing protein n=1 Tax=Anaerotalea alkaliphila TaxID=2662126 RepID=A0A7X5HXY9_9FIRM|nr:PhoU domain-containing protein [Anaerotalea alkaliphila]NDL68705.1 hypothetical protein [Anaerotalea alkaliphila]